MSHALTAAPLARLRAELQPGITVYDAQVPKGVKLPARYVVYYPGTAPLARDRFAPASSMARLRWQVTCVGVLREQAQAVLDAARRALVDVVLTVPGWQLSPAALDEAFTAPVQRDDDVDPPVFYAIDQYLATAVPA